MIQLVYVVKTQSLAYTKPTKNLDFKKKRTLSLLGFTIVFKPISHDLAEKTGHCLV